MKKLWMFAMVVMLVAAPSFAQEVCGVGDAPPCVQDFPPPDDWEYDEDGFPSAWCKTCEAGTYGASYCAGHLVTTSSEYAGGNWISGSLDCTAYSAPDDPGGCEMARGCAGWEMGGRGLRQEINHFDLATATNIRYLLRNKKKPLGQADIDALERIASLAANECPDTFDKANARYQVFQAEVSRVTGRLLKDRRAMVLPGDRPKSPRTLVAQTDIE